MIVRPDRTIASVGYNGFAKQMEDNSDLYSDRDKKYSRIIHAEINAMIHCNESVRGYTLYTYPLCPCDRCAVQFIQAGISKVVFSSATANMLERWGDILDKSKSYFREAEVEVTIIEE